MNHVDALGAAALALLVGALASPAAAVEPGALVDPRPAHHAVDRTSTLGPAELSEIDALAKSASRAGELLVVVVPSLDGAAPQAWATSLFRRLKLDAGAPRAPSEKNQARDRGVLLVVAVDDHAAAIVLGDGWPPGTSSVTDDIVASHVLPHFAAHEPPAAGPSAAIVDGARHILNDVIVPSPVALVPQIITVPYPVPARPASTPSSSSRPPRAARPLAAPDSRDNAAPSPWAWLLVTAAVCALLAVVVVARRKRSRV